MDLKVGIYKIFSLASRVVIGAFATLVGAGAILSESYLTGIGGISLGLLATVNPPNFKRKTNISYWLVFVAWVFVFIAWSYFDMRNNQSL